MRNVDVCLSPNLFELYDHDDCIVVIVDIFRATSCMTTAIAHGIKEIKPVASVEACSALRKKGYKGAAERDGKKVEGFDLGNSPFSYMDATMEGESLAMTTTNGTKAIENARNAKEIIIGSFLNISAVEKYLREKKSDVIILCAGWKGKVNLEDTIFAGALIDRLCGDFQVNHDGSAAAHAIYNISQPNLLEYLSNSSHARRLNRLNIQKDIEFCLKTDIYNVVPVMKDGVLVNCIDELSLIDKTVD